MQRDITNLVGIDMGFEMVKTEEVESWKCPYCRAKFRDNDDCDEHIQETHLDSPIHNTDIIYKCDGCHDEFKTYQEAFKCEQDHEEGNDLHYQALIRQQEMDKLIEAGNHPAQKKLVVEQ